MAARILIVDDDPLVLETITAMLRSARCEVEAADSAQQALTRLDEESYDCIISDMLMPGIDGSEFIQAIRARKADIKIVACSGGDAGVPASLPLTAAKALGADAVLQKPVSRNRLVEVLHEIGCFPTGEQGRSG